MYSFKLPDIGEGVNEGEIVKWHINAGDHINRDQDMVEVMTDKVTVKIPSPVEGTVEKLYFEEGALVEVGQVLLDIRAEGEAEEAPATEPQPTEQAEPEQVREEPPAAPQEEEPEELEGGIALASPAVRRIARERGIKLSQVRGTGPNGRVTLEDLEGGVEAEPARAEEPAPSAVPVEEEAAPEVREKAPAAPPKVEEKTPAPAAASGDEEILVPKGLRRLIFEKMTKSKQIMPHFSVMEEIDVGPLRENIDKLKRDGVSVSFTPFFVKAAALALKDFPYINATYDEESRSYRLKKYYNIGVAIDTPDGLTVAVVKGVGKKSLVTISGEISDLAKRARENQLKLEEVQDSTFTVTNVGSIAGIMSTPIINYPEVAILGVHRTLTEMQKDGTEREKMFISLSCDHRLVDGAVAARFMKRLKGLLEEPILILSQ